MSGVFVSVSGVLIVLLRGTEMPVRTEYCTKRAELPFWRPLPRVVFHGMGPAFNKLQVKLFAAFPIPGSRPATNARRATAQPSVGATLASHGKHWHGLGWGKWVPGVVPPKVKISRAEANPRLCRYAVHRPVKRLPQRQSSEL